MKQIDFARYASFIASFAASFAGECLSANPDKEITSESSNYFSAKIKEWLEVINPAAVEKKPVERMDIGTAFYLSDRLTRRIENLQIALNDLLKEVDYNTCRLNPPSSSAHFKPYCDSPAVAQARAVLYRTELRSAETKSG